MPYDHSINLKDKRIQNYKQKYEVSVSKSKTLLYSGAKYIFPKWLKIIFVIYNIKKNSVDRFISGLKQILFKHLFPTQCLFYPLCSFQISQSPGKIALGIMSVFSLCNSTEYLAHSYCSANTCWVSWKRLVPPHMPRSRDHLPNKTGQVYWFIFPENVLGKRIQNL